MVLVRILILFFLIRPCFGWDLHDFKDEALSPWTTKAKTIFFIGTGLTVAVLAFEDSIVDPTQEDVVNDKPLGSFSKYGDLAGSMVPNLAYSLMQTIAGGLYDDPYGHSRAIGMLKASGYAAGVSTILKNTIQEPRPNSNDRNSFPSGHATTAFAFSGYVWEEHGWMAGVPSTLIASFVGLSRMNDNRHYLHDVIAGSTIGAMYGVSISIIDREKRAAKKNEASVSIVPLYDSQTKGLALYAEF
jgi:membrane-associated phospholipid phosphatase